MEDANRPPDAAGPLGRAVPKNPDEGVRRARLVPLDRVLFAAAWVFIIGVVVLALIMARSTHVPELEDYGYDLSNLSVDRTLVVSAGMPRGVLVGPAGEVLRPSGVSAGGMRGLVDPHLLTAADVAALNAEGRRATFLVSDDRVVGVVINGEARAYPVRVLNWHEVVNDVVGGVPIAVTYSPLSDSVVVFDRRVGDVVLEFAHSGLVYNSNLLMYDLQEATAASSLWSQLRFEAISGPQAGTMLTVLPMSVARWAAWLAEHPETTVVRGTEAYKKQYRKNPYGQYFATADLQYPVGQSITIPEGQARIPLMDRIVAIPRSAAGVLESEGGRAVATPLAEPGAAAVEVASTATIGGTEWVTFEAREVIPGSGPAGLTVDPSGEAPTFLQPGPGEAAQVPAVYATRFAWHAMYGGLDVTP